MEHIMAVSVSKDEQQKQITHPGTQAQSGPNPCVLWRLWFWVYCITRATYATDDNQG